MVKVSKNDYGCGLMALEMVAWIFLLLVGIVAVVKLW